MCGIVGYIGFDETSHNALPKALATIVHRGPDDRGLVRRGDVSLGMTRLAIIDLPGGQQPMSSPDGRLCVVFNGEIYNYVELRSELIRRGHTFGTKSDTEVLLHLYEEYGDDMCRHLRGMFAFAIHDLPGRRVYLARDRFGKKPLYLRTVGDQVWFGSEIKAVIAASGAAQRARVSEQAIYDFLTFGSIPQPATIYEDVAMLSPGCHATIRPGEVLKVVQYWEPAIEPDPGHELEEATREVRRLVSEAVRIRLRADVPLGVFLSGGLDSSIVAYEAAQHTGPSLRTFTVSTGDPSIDETEVAARTAERLGVRHEVLPLSVDVEESVLAAVAHFDQPFADSSAIPSMQIARLAGQHVKVVLNGDGGDELFGGYRRHVAAAQLDRLGRAGRAAVRLSGVAGSWGAQRRSRLGLVLRLARGLAVGHDARYLIFTHDMFREADRCRFWRGTTDLLPSERHLVTPSRTSVLSVQMLNDVRLNLVSDLLVKIDMACMASSVEGRSPFLDADLADFAFTLPDEFKVRGATGKWLLRRAYAGELSDEVLRGAKKGFEVPLRRWLDHELRPLILDAVLTPEARVNAYLDAAEVGRIFSGGVLGDRNLASIQYAVLVLELWLRQSEASEWVTR